MLMALTPLIETLLEMGLGKLCGVTTKTAKNFNNSRHRKLDTDHHQLNGAILLTFSRND